MTGEKDRYKTQEKLWKIDDEQLKTPKHDELVLMATPDFLLNKLPRVTELVLDFNNWYWRYIDHEFNDEEALTYLVNNNHETHRFSCIERVQGTENWKLKSVFKPPYGVDNLTECQIKYNQESKITFEKDLEEAHNAIDLYKRKSKLCETAYSLMREKFSNLDFSTLFNVEHEVPILGRNDYIVGYWDILLSGPKPIEIKFDHDYHIDFRPHHHGNIVVCIEVKPTIPSYGAVLRQLRTYQQYRKYNEFQICLLTNESKFDEAFISQGITVIHPT